VRLGRRNCFNLSNKLTVQQPENMVGRDLVLYVKSTITCASNIGSKVICKQVCQLLGGEISVNSQENYGTSVSFTLPLSETTAVTSKKPSSLENSPLVVGIVTKSELVEEIIGNYLASSGIKQCILF
jgi:hypothetical protein